MFLAFVSPSAISSENCINELEFAVSRKRSILVVHLQETTVPAGLELSLGRRQAIRKAEFDTSTYQDRLSEGLSNLLSSADRFITVKGRRDTSITSRIALVAVVVLLVVLVVLVATQLFDTTAKPDLRLAIAVRPFETITTDADSANFADGIADDLLLRLGHWRNLPVIARGSSFAESLPTDPMAAGQTLNARYLVEGIVRSNRTELRLDVFLVDAANGRNVWSQVYQYPWSDALALQAEIADAIVAEINPALVSAETQRAVRADPSNLDAWSAAMRGWWHLNTETQDGLIESQSWFEKAAELDPAWSWPNSAQALAAYRSIINGWSADMRASAGRLIQAANKAVQLDPRDAFAHHAMGHAYAIQGQIDQSLSSLALGVEFSPNDPMANACYAMQLAASNRPTEAFPFVDHAIAISPDDPWQHRFALVRARAHFSASEYAAAEEWALRSQQLRPSNGAFLHSVSAPALGEGIERARKRTEEARKLGPLPQLARIEQGFKRQTHPEYVARLIEGLRRAGFE